MGADSKSPESDNMTVTNDSIRLVYRRPSTYHQHVKLFEDGRCDTSSISLFVIRAEDCVSNFSWRPDILIEVDFAWGLFSRSRAA